VNYLLDTNILVIYGRDAKIADEIEKEYAFFNGNHNLAISVVSLGELNSLAKQFKYSEKSHTAQRVGNQSSGEPIFKIRKLET